MINEPSPEPAFILTFGLRKRNYGKENLAELISRCPTNVGKNVRLR